MDPDADLLARVARGEGRAVRELVERKLHRLLSLSQRLLGRREEAEEVVQEVFLRVWKQAPNWQPGIARFDTWLHRVTLNLCYDRLRERRNDEPYEEEHDIADSAPAPDEAVHREQRNAILSAALASLPPRQREALILQYYQGLSNIEAAALMNISAEALESLLARARRGLHARLTAIGKEKP